MRCIVCNLVCNAYTQQPGISFHKFPKNLESRQKWLDFLHNCSIDTSGIEPLSAICSKHFKKSDFKEYTSIRNLKKNSVPSIGIDGENPVPYVISSLQSPSALDDSNSNGCTLEPIVIINEYEPSESFIKEENTSNHEDSSTLLQENTTNDTQRYQWENENYSSGLDRTYELFPNLKWTNETTFRLIEEYKKKELLWNRNHQFQDHINKEREEAWNSISKIMNISIVELKRKMLYLRRAFRREQIKLFKKTKASPTWFAFNKLLFLKENMLPNFERSPENSTTVNTATNHVEYSHQYDLKPSLIPNSSHLVINNEMNAENTQTNLSTTVNTMTNHTNYYGQYDPKTSLLPIGTYLVLNKDMHTQDIQKKLVHSTTVNTVTNHTNYYNQHDSKNSLIPSGTYLVINNSMNTQDTQENSSTSVNLGTNYRDYNCQDDSKTSLISNSSHLVINKDINTQDTQENSAPSTSVNLGTNYRDYNCLYESKNRLIPADGPYLVFNKNINTENRQENLFNTVNNGTNYGNYYYPYASSNSLISRGSHLVKNNEMDTENTQENLFNTVNNGTNYGNYYYPYASSNSLISCGSHLVKNNEMDTENTQENLSNTINIETNYGNFYYPYDSSSNLMSGGSHLVINNEMDTENAQKNLSTSVNIGTNYGDNYFQHDSKNSLISNGSHLMINNSMNTQDIQENSSSLNIETNYRNYYSQYDSKNSLILDGSNLVINNDMDIRNTQENMYDSEDSQLSNSLRLVIDEDMDTDSQENSIDDYNFQPLNDDKKNDVIDAESKEYEMYDQPSTSNSERKVVDTSPTKHKTDEMVKTPTLKALFDDCILYGFKIGNKMQNFNTIKTCLIQKYINNIYSVDINETNLNNSILSPASSSASSTLLDRQSDGQ